MRINLYAGPGAGKTSLAEGISSKLKIAGYSVELVQEYIKDWAYQKIVPTGFDQVYVFAKQLHKEDLLLRYRDHIVTDSPLLLQCCYVLKYGTPFFDELLSLCKKFEAEHPSINLFLNRASIPYKPAGRYETREEALTMDLLICKTLDQLSIPYMVVDSADHSGILALVQNLIKDSHE